MPGAFDQLLIACSVTFYRSRRWVLRAIIKRTDEVGLHAFSWKAAIHLASADNTIRFSFVGALGFIPQPNYYFEPAALAVVRCFFSNEIISFDTRARRVVRGRELMVWR